MAAKELRNVRSELPAISGAYEEIPDINGRGSRNVADFGSAYSVFLSDLYGHSSEITTYDYEFVSEKLDPQ